MRGVKQGPGKRKKKLDKSHAEIILRVRHYFEKERDQKLCPEVAQVHKRASNETGVNEVTLRKIRIEAGVENWEYNPGEKVNVERQNEVPEQFCVLVRQVIRDMFLDKKTHTHS